MAESKEAYLNQPYYGPSVLPLAETQTTPPIKTLTSYSLICTIIKVTALILIAIGIIVLVLWLIYQPQSIKVNADAAFLSAFNLSGVASASDNTTETLVYNLTVDLSFRNPNRKYSIYYERMQAQAFYAEEQIGAVGLPQLYQKRKSTLPLSVRFEGKAEIAGNRDQTAAARSFEKEMREGFFYVGVKIHAGLRLKMLVIKSVQFKPDVDCYLRIPVPSNATSLAAGFARTECDVHNFS